jgi:pimeloyl-ACP methyl ester carboxylesterase
MIHGAFCTGWAFAGWRGLFEQQGYRVHTPTLRHHDQGDYPPDSLGATSMLDYAGDLERLIDGLDGPPILVGHSLGGLLAQMLAARRTLHALVLLAPCAPWGMLPSTTFELFSAQALFLAGYWKMIVRPTQWVAAANALDQLSETDRESIYARFVPESGLAAFETMLWFLDLKRATSVDPRTVVCPTLCIAGGRDRMNPPATVRRLARRYGGRARYEELKNHSHWLIGEPGWQKIVRSCLIWLDRIHDEAEAGTSA